MSPDDRRPFRGAPYERGRTDRPMGGPPDRNDRPPSDRPAFNGPRPFVRPPTRGGDMPPPDHSVRLRDGEREVEISGNPAFVRQVLDDLPVLMARLRGEVPGRTAISMPAPPAGTDDLAADAPGASRPQQSRVHQSGAELSHPEPSLAEVPDSKAQPTETADELAQAEPVERSAKVRGGTAAMAGGDAALQERVLEVLRGSNRPLPIAAIRQRLDDDVSGQQVRRLLEKATTQVSVSSDKPAAYSLR